MDKSTTHEAAREFARLLSGEKSVQDVRQGKNWRSRDIAWQKDFIHTAHTLADLEALANDPDILALAEPAPIVTRWVRKYRKSLAAAAGVLLAVAVSLFHVFESETKSELGTDVKRYVTRVGEQKTIDLSDGSIMTLNTGTQVLVDITGEARRVILERGEVYFDVASDATRTFSVDLGVRSVTVLGTAFNIQKTPDTFTVSVAEGMVSIHKKDVSVSSSSPLLVAPTGELVRLPSSGQQRLQAGRAATYDVNTNEIVGFTPTNIKRLHSWRTGLIQFDREPLYKVIQELNRYSAKKILIEDMTIMDMKIYAAIKVGKVEDALVGLENTLPIKVTSYFDRIVIVGRDN